MTRLSSKKDRLSKMRTRTSQFSVPIGLLLVIFVFLTLTPFLIGQTSRNITGTYTNMSYIEDAGDVVGYEIKIVFIGDGFQGALQIAEGVPGKLILVEVQSPDTKVSFSIPDSSGPYAGQFVGTIEGSVLKGEFRFKDGGSDKVELKRGKSYWD